MQQGGASLSSWWKPPGLLDVSSHSSSRGPIKKASSELVDAAEAYLNAQTPESLAVLHQLTWQASAITVAFATHHVALCLRLLDTLAEAVISMTQDDDHTHQSHLPQALEVLYAFCQNAAIGYPSHAFGKLLQWLVSNITAMALNQGNTAENDVELLKLQLVVMAETLKTNAGVRIYAKEMSKVKEFYRSLTILLNTTEDSELLVFSMTILARLVLSDPLGAKLFSSKNVDQAVELVFSVLEGSWQDVSDGRTSLLSRQSLLQFMSIDLLFDLADRAEILIILEKHGKMEVMIDNLVMAINLNADTKHIRLAIQFLSGVVTLGRAFRKMLMKALADNDVLCRVLQVTLHPSKMVAMQCIKLVLKVMGEDSRPLQGLFDSPTQVTKLHPVITGLFRSVNESVASLERPERTADRSMSEDYLHSVEACQLLAKISEFPATRAFCTEAISFNQSATLIQVEAAHVDSMEAQDFVRYHPRLSIHLVMLLSNLLNEPTMTEKTRRTLNQFLQSSEVSLVVGAAMFNRNDKEMVVDTVLLLHQFFCQSNNKRFLAFSLAEGILSFGQRLGDANENLQSIIASHEANYEANMKVIEKLQMDLQQTARLQDEIKAKQDQELREIKNKFIEQARQKDEVLMKTREMYETKLRELNAQCESMGQHMNKHLSALQHRDQLLHETRSKRCVLEEENHEYKRKVQVLEIRLEEIAQSHSVVNEEMRIRERETEELREEITALSSDYTTRREELEQTREELTRLEAEMKEKDVANENTYKELVLLSKAHKAVSEEKSQLLVNIESLRDELSHLESLHINAQARLKEKKDAVEQLERKVARLTEAASMHQSAMDEEREKRRAAARDLEDFRKAHRKLESDIAMLEIRAAEQRLLLESKDDHLRKCEDEIRHLTNEIGKQVKLQSLIHQLSSGGDVQALAGSSFLARDS